MPSASRTPTIRSPGTAPPLGANLTGVSRSMPRSGSAPPASDSPGTRNTRSAAFGNPNQPLSFWGTAGPGLRSSLKFGNTARTTRQRALEFCFRELFARALERALDDLAPETPELRLRRLARRPANGGAGAPRHHHAVPRRRRSAALGARNQHLVAVVQFRDERRDTAVDLRADRGIADVGMDRVGEVDRRCATRQRDQPPLRSEAEHLVVKQLELGVLEEFFRIVA